MNDRSRRLGAVFIAALMGAPFMTQVHLARASEADKKALATEFFARGVKLMDAGACVKTEIKDRAICDEARDNFQRAYDIYPEGLGALRNLAYVERGLGRYASAARRFRELQQLAPKDPNPKRHAWAKFATAELSALDPLIPHVMIEPPANRPTDLAIFVDEKPLPRPAWGTTIEIDPGAHAVRAIATGQPPFETKFTMAIGETKTVIVTLGDVVGASSEKAQAAPDSIPVDAADRGSLRRTVPLIIAGTGAATVIVGLAFGYAAVQSKKDACGDGKLCEPNGLEDARSWARMSNLVTGIGATLLVGGVVWYAFTKAPASNQSAVHLVPMGSDSFAGALLIGRFR